METKIQPKFKINKAVTGTIIIAAAVVLIFFSKTVYNHNLPVVTAAMPKNGRLSKTEYITGTVSWRDVERLYAELGGVIEETLAREGDYVEEGQPLIRMTYDKEDIEAKLKETEQSRSKLKLDLQDLNLRVSKLKRQIESLESEVYELPAQSEYELLQLEIDLRNAEATLRDLYDRSYEEESNVSYSDIQKARSNIDSIQLKIDQWHDNQRQQAEDAQAELQEKEKNRESTLKDYNTELEQLQISIKAKKLDLDILDEREAEYNATLLDWESKTEILAPVSGRILTLDAHKGERINANQLVATFGAGNTFAVEAVLSRDNSFVAVGDECKLINSTNSLVGTVTKLEAFEGGKNVTIELDAPTLSAGETLEVQFKKDSLTSYTLVPNGAVNKDSDGYFLYRIKRREGVMGEEYYVDRLDVYIGDSDADNTAVTQGIGFFEPIVLISDSTLSNGVTVSVSNEGDL